MDATCDPRLLLTKRVKQTAENLSVQKYLQNELHLCFTMLWEVIQSNVVKASGEKPDNSHIFVANMLKRVEPNEEAGEHFSVK